MSCVVATTNWESKRLDEVAEILDSRRAPVNAKERETRRGDVPYYGATGQVGWIDDYLFDEEIVLLGEDGAPFLDSSKQKAYLVRGKSWVNNHAHVLRARPGVPALYLKYWLDRVDYRQYVNGTTRLKLTQAEMRRIPVPLAPIHVRNGIVAEIEKQFSRLDEAVANLQRVKANFRRYKASVLSAAVEGRLVETEASMALRERRPFEPAEELLARILEARRANWKGKYDAPIDPICPRDGDLPKGWTWVTVSQVMRERIVNGLSIKESATPTSVRALRLSSMSDRGLDFDDFRYLPIEPEKVEDIVVCESDYFVSRGNGTLELVGRGSPSSKSAHPVIFPDTMMRIRFTEAATIRPWFQAVWATRMVRQQIEERVKTTAGIYKIAQPELASITIPLPPLAEQERIVAEIDRRLSIVREIEVEVDASLKRAQALRQAVLAKAFSH